jgi:hypothetical protein
LAKLPGRPAGKILASPWFDPRGRMPRPDFTKDAPLQPWSGSVEPALAERSHKRLYHNPQPGISARNAPGDQGTEPRRHEPAATRCVLSRLPLGKASS